MDKATLIADETGARLSLNQGVVILEQPDGRKHRVGMEGLKQIVVKGDLQLSSKLIMGCLGADVSLVLLPGRSQEPARHLFAQHSGLQGERLAQYAAYLDEGRRLALAQQAVVAKIEAQSECLRNRGLVPDLGRFVTHARQTGDVASLLGVEGAASARYFSAWSTLIQPAWGFRGRNRRPPRDPVNALMSLSYTLVSHAMGRLVAQAGLEPALGFLHAPDPGRPSLALDLMEPLRPWVDEWVLSLCEGGDMAPEDFTQDPVLGCRLSKPASGRYYQCWFGGASTWFEHEGRSLLEKLRSALGVPQGAVA
jgi:CRISPR-associated protein Cas1